MKPFDVNAQGYGTYAYRNRRVIVAPVYRVGGNDLGYRYKIPGHYRFWGFGRGFNTLEKCLRFAALRIDKLVL